MPTSETGWNDFLNLCLGSGNATQLTALFDLFLTPEEKQNLALRCLIIKKLLQQQQTQRQIAKELNVSIAKITRGSNELKRLDKKLRNYLITHLN